MISDIKIIITRLSRLVLLVPYVYIQAQNIYSVLAMTNYWTLTNVKIRQYILMYSSVVKNITFVDMKFP